MASFIALRGLTLITLRAAFALKVIGSLVKGLTPSCFGVAGLSTIFSLSKPGMRTSPGPRLPSCWATIVLIVSSADTACFLSSPLFSASEATNWDLFILLFGISMLLGLSDSFLYSLGLRDFLHHRGSFLGMVNTYHHISLRNDSQDPVVFVYDWNAAQLILGHGVEGFLQVIVGAAGYHLVRHNGLYFRRFGIQPYRDDLQSQITISDDANQSFGLLVLNDRYRTDMFFPHQFGSF